MKAPTARLKLSDKLLRNVRCGYLYANGKLVLVHEDRHPKAGTVEWVTIHETPVHCSFTGRIVLHRCGPVRLVLQALRLDVHEPSVDGGSENTRRRNLAIGHVTVTLGPETYTDALFIPIVDGLSSDFCYQPENVWTDLEVPTRWAGYEVSA